MLYMHSDTPVTRLSLSSMAFVVNVASRSLVAIPFVLAASVLVWRLWRFTIKPLFKPYEPLAYPYWLPVIGNGIEYMRDAQAFVTKARLHFRDERKPFSINIFGQHIYIITSPSDVLEVYRRTTALTHDIFLEDLMRGFESTPEAVQRVFWRPKSDGAGHQFISPNPNHQSLSRVTVDMFRKQLHPGPMLTKMGTITLDYIERAASWECLSDRRYLVSESSYEGWKDISLLHFCEDVILRAATRSFFGDALLEHSPNLIDDFLAFDDLSYKMMYRYPSAWNKDMRTARDGVIDAIEVYFRLPENQRADRNWFIAMQEAELLALEVSIPDIARLVTMIYWVINTNAYKLLFWMLSFLLKRPELVNDVTKELQSCFRVNGTLDIDSLQSPVVTPRLTALFHETLRVSNSSVSARYVNEDTSIGRYKIRAGNRVIIPYRQLHQNEAAFPDATHFDINRFLKDPKLAQSPSFKPFGGGLWYCPGRHLAKQEIFMAMAFLLCRFDVELSNKTQEVPMMDEKKPGFGIVSPVRGGDMILRLRQKKSPFVMDIVAH